jgi:hypothetical protein
MDEVTEQKPCTSEEASRRWVQAYKSMDEAQQQIVYFSKQLQENKETLDIAFRELTEKYPDHKINFCQICYGIEGNFSVWHGKGRCEEPGMVKPICSLQQVEEDLGINQHHSS